MKYSLGFVLALSLAGLQFIAISIVVTTSYLSSERAMLSHARSLLSDAGVVVAQHSRSFLEPARDVADLSGRILEQGIVPASDPIAIEAYLFQQLQAEPQIAGVFFGDVAGNFVYVMRSDGPAAFRTKTVSRSGEARSTELVWRDADFSIAQRTPDPTDRFDPRLRPWFIQALDARGSSWTDPYIFFSSQKPGITVSSPVSDAAGDLMGVVGVDIEIADISDFLGNLSVGENGVTLILDQSGNVIAHPDRDQVTIKNDDGSLRLANIKDFADPISRTAFENLEPVSGGTTKKQANFTYDDERYLALLSPVADLNLPWTIAIYAPENDFVGVIKNNRARNIWIAAVISILTALVGLSLAERILRPVRAFAVRTSLVSQGEVSPDEALPKTYRELRAANRTLISEIAQRRRSEATVQELNRDMVHLSRVNTLEQMATGLAHELSQPLTAITQNVDAAISTASQDPNVDSDLMEILRELDEQAHQGGDIIRSLRGFIGKDDGEVAAFDLHALVQQTSRLMRHEFEVNAIDFTYDAAKIPAAQGNRVQIAQVLINLMRNAVEAIAESDAKVRKLTVSIQEQDGQLEVRVDDTGPGVPDDVVLFKQFQTSKSGGMGLGLSICRKIVAANGGRLWHEASMPDATRFCFTLQMA